jgi:hypothetical protein
VAINYITGEFFDENAKIGSLYSLGADACLELNSVRGLGD